MYWENISITTYHYREMVVDDARGASKKERKTVAYGTSNIRMQCAYSAEEVLKLNS